MASVASDRCGLADPCRRPVGQDGPVDMAHLADQARRAGRSAGLDAVGIASAEPFADARAALEQRKAAGLHGGMAFTYRNPARSTDPSRSLAGAQSLVVGARSYRRAAPPRRAGAAVAEVASYSWRDHYEPLRSSLKAVAGVLREAGYRAIVLVDDNALVDRAAAARAGIGWLGKNTNVLLAGHGSWFVLGSVVTDAPLPADVVEPEDGCGSCARCQAACPTGALDEPGVLDARRCLAWLLEAPGSFPLEHRAALGGRIYGCDECQVVCPPNRVGDLRHPPPPAVPDDEAWVDLVAMLDLDDDELISRFARWYVPQRQPRYLRRNALVAIGNVGDPRDHDVRRVVLTACADQDPIVREHATWAAAALGLLPAEPASA